MSSSDAAARRRRAMPRRHPTRSGGFHHLLPAPLRPAHPATRRSQPVNRITKSINALPFELVVRIFVYCNFWDRFRLSWACSRFYEIACNTATIWQSLYCGIKTPRPELLLLAFQRSRSLPVDLEIGNYARVFHLIDAQFSRLRSLLSSRPADLPDAAAMPYAITRAAPMLEHLCIRGIRPISADFLGRHSAMLRRLEANWLSLPNSPGSNVPALQPLQHIVLRYRQSALPTSQPLDLTPLFGLCPNLQSFTVSGYECITLPSGRPPATLSRVAINVTDSSVNICTVLARWLDDVPIALSVVFSDGSGPDDLLPLLQTEFVRIRVIRGDFFITLQQPTRPTCQITIEQFLEDCPLSFLIRDQLPGLKELVLSGSLLEEPDGVECINAFLPETCSVTVDPETP